MKPLDIGSLLDTSFRLYWRNLRTLAACAVVVAVPISLLTTAILALVDPDSFTRNQFDFSESATQELEFDGGTLAGYFGAAIVGMLGGLLVTAACLRAIATAYVGAAATWRESLAFALRRLPGLIWVTVLTMFAVVGGLLLCIVPGVWLYVMLALGPPALLLEELRGPAALRRSWELVKGRFWSVALALLVGVAVTGAAAFAFGMVRAAIVMATPDATVFNAVLQTAINIFTATFVQPVAAVILALVYFDARVRHDGLGTAGLARALGLPEPEGYRGFLPPRPPA